MHDKTYCDHDDDDDNGDEDDDDEIRTKFSISSQLQNFVILRTTKTHSTYCSVTLSFVIS